MVGSTQAVGPISAQSYVTGIDRLSGLGKGNVYNSQNPCCRACLIAVAVGPDIETPRQPVLAGKSSQGRPDDSVGENLREVMFQMPDIVVHEIIERRWFILWHRMPR